MTWLTTSVNDGTLLIREMAGDAAGNASQKIAPSEEQRRNMDRPADDNTWHGTPNMSAGNIRSQFKDTVNRNTPLNKEDLQAAKGDATQQAHPDGSRDPRDAARLAAQDQGRGTGQSGVDAAGGVKQGVDTLRQRANDNIDPETKDRARETKEVSKEKTRQFMRSHMPQERREQTDRKSVV